jgi:hypothetical protein
MEHFKGRGASYKRLGTSELSTKATLLFNNTVLVYFHRNRKASLENSNVARQQIHPNVAEI